MHHRREPQDCNFSDRWLRIQHKDAFQALVHLQNQLSTTQESVACFQSTLYGMNVNDELLLEIKSAVSKVTLAMDEMRLRFKSVGFNPGIQNHPFNPPQRTPPFTPTPRFVAVPTIFQPINLHFLPNPNQSDRRLSAQSDAPSNDRRTHEERSYSQMPAQIYSAPPQPATPYFAHPSNVDPGASSASDQVPMNLPSNVSQKESFQSQSPSVNIESVKVLGADGDGAQASHEHVYEEPGMLSEPIHGEDVVDTTRVSDQTLEMTLDAISGRTPDRKTQSFLEQEPETYPGEVPEYVIDQTAAAVPSCEASQDFPEHVDQIPEPVPVYEASSIDYYAPEQSSTPVPADEGSYEAPEYVVSEYTGEVTTEIPTPICEESSEEAPGNPLDETLVASGEDGEMIDQPAEGVRYYDETGAVLHYSAEAGMFYAVDCDVKVAADESVATSPPALVESVSNATSGPFVEPSDSRLTPCKLSAIASAQLVESLLAEPKESSPAVPTPKLNPSKDIENKEITSSQHSAGVRGATGNAPQSERRDSLELPESNPSSGDIPFPAAKYRSGRESSHSNGSIDGFNSPTPSEARTVCNQKTSPNPCEVDELAKSLEEHWSLSDPLAASSAGKRSVVCIPKDGVLPVRIEEYRMPPPLKYVRSLVSYCSNGSLFLQLMEDERPILKLDGPIERGAKGPPLKFSEVQPGDYVLCLFDADNRFYRARLLKAKGEDKFEVRFIDYGNKCVTSVKNMRRLPEHARSLGQCALKCELSDELRPKATDIIDKLERVSLESNFFACFAETYKARDSKSPIFTLIDIELMDGSSLIQIPPPITLEVSNTKFLVRNLVLGTLETAKIDFVGDLKRKEAIADLLKSIPSFPCEKRRVKEGSLVSYQCQRARVTKVGPGDLLSLDLIDEFQIEPRNVPIEACNSLPLAAINFPPAASCIVRVAKGQDIGTLRELSQSESDIEMTVVGQDVLPLVKFSKPFIGTSVESSDEY